MQGEVRGLPLAYSYISLIGEGEKKGVLPERGKGRSERGRKMKGKQGNGWKDRVWQ